MAGSGEGPVDCWLWLIGRAVYSGQAIRTTCWWQFLIGSDPAAPTLNPHPNTNPFFCWIRWELTKGGLTVSQIPWNSMSKTRIFSPSWIRGRRPLLMALNSCRKEDHMFDQHSEAPNQACKYLDTLSRSHAYGYLHINETPFPRLWGQACSEVWASTLDSVVLANNRILCETRRK